MTAVIFAGGHRFHQSTVAVDAKGRPCRFVWTCERCRVRVDPSQPFTECKAAQS